MAALLLCCQTLEHDGRHRLIVRRLHRPSQFGSGRQVRQHRQSCPCGFISKRFNGQLAPADEKLPAVIAIREGATRIAELYEAREFGKAVREIMALTDGANQYVDSVKPWELAKQEGKDAELHAACSNA